MKKAWLCCIVLLVVWAGPVFGETLHLFSGERIKGKITAVDEDTLSVESDLGFGLIEIPKSEISLIEFEEARRNLERKMGFGYYHRVTPNTQDGSALEYAVDAFSIKYWLSAWASLDFLVGFFSFADAGVTTFEIFSLDIRYAKVFQRRSEFDFYWGGSIGYIDVEDQTVSPAIVDSGQTLRGFLGVEIFFVTMPGLGFSSEIGFGSQSVGSREITSISSTTFPTLSVRYYF